MTSDYAPSYDGGAMPPYTDAVEFIRGGVAVEGDGQGGSRRHNRASHSWLSVIVVGLLVAGCATAPTSTRDPASDASFGPGSPSPVSASVPSNPSSAAGSQLPPTPMTSFATITGAPNLFSGPDGLGLDQQGNLFVADAGNSRIQKFDGEEHLLTKWGSHGSKDGQFDCRPFCGLAVGGRGDVFVTDAGNARVQKFDSSGKFLSKWGGSRGNQDGQFLAPFGIAVDRQGNVYVGDSLLSRVQQFDNSGKFLAKWGSRGSDDGQFSEDLADIAVDALGNIYVTDRQNGVQKFDSGMTFVAKWDGCGDDRPLVSATGVAIDTQGNIYVNDLANGRICKYDGDGTFLTALSGFTGDVGFIAVGKQGDIYGSEPFDDLVLRFQQP